MDPADVLASIVPAVTGGVIAWSATAATYRTKERRALRRAACHAIVPRLEDLLRLVRMWDPNADSAHWHTATETALNAIEAESHLLPHSWQHLRFSVRALIGEATGIFAFADRTPHDPALTLPDRCPIWVSNAEDYLCYALRGLRAWRDAVTLSRRRVPDLIDFDAWLRTRT